MRKFYGIDYEELSCIVTVHYLFGDMQEFPFGSEAVAITFRDRMRKRKDVISVTLSKTTEKTH